MTDEMNGSVNRVWLRGFLRGVDCRPVHFRDALRSTLVCNLCGLVARRTASFPCSHVFCEFCFWDCTTDDPGAEGRCIFDRSVIDGDTVRWNETQPLDLVNAKVRCWNARYGCDFTGPLRGLLDHFEHDCTFQAAICPRCHIVQLRSKLADHYRAGCVAPSTATSRGEPPTSERRRLGRSARRCVACSCARHSRSVRDQDERATGAHASAGHPNVAPSRRYEQSQGGAGEATSPKTPPGEVLPGVPAGVGVSAADDSREMASGPKDTSATRLLHSTEADLSSPLVPEVWTTRCETPDRTCNVKLVLLEENATLSVYAAADQCVDAFNPWSLRSVTFTSPRRLFLPGRPKLLTPTWLVSRQSRASLSDQGFERFRSRPLGEILRSCCFFGRDEEVVVLTVKLVRKFDTL
ncbi:hypothetical protein MTO96_018829 [Rhipicephalus appendiculatus]